MFVDQRATSWQWAGGAGGQCSCKGSYWSSGTILDCQPVVSSSTLEGVNVRILFISFISSALLRNKYIIHSYGT